MHHWAYKTSQNCDPWWENETEWHRKWKEHFSENFQEYLMIDQNTGEKHIADIRTDKGFVIEFQHSSIKPEEKDARESFYKNMVWVVSVVQLLILKIWKQVLKFTDLTLTQWLLILMH